jgi:hypothetical protein
VGDVPPARLTGTNAVFELPAGSPHDLVAPGFAAHRLLQYAPDHDFEIEQKWETVPTARFQNEGLIVQRTSRLPALRAPLHGHPTRLYAASVVGGVTTTRIDTPVTVESSIVLRAKRVGDHFTLSYAADGGALTQLVEFDFALAVLNVGAFVANSNPSVEATPEFVASLDYFHNVADALPDDSDTTPPAISNVVVTPSASSAVVSWDTDEPATSVVDAGTTTAYGQTVSDATKVLHHAVSVSNLTCNTEYHFKASSADLGQSGESGDLIATTAPCAVFTSDNFNLTTLDPKWSYIDPKGDAPGPQLSGTDAVIPWPQARARPRRASSTLPGLQAAPNEDLGVEAGWRTVPPVATQSEGILAMQTPAPSRF